MTVNELAMVIVGTIAAIGGITGVISFFIARFNEAKKAGMQKQMLDTMIQALDNNTCALKSVELLVHEHDGRIISLEEFRKYHERGNA